MLEGTDVCFAPVLPMSEAKQHPHVVARGIIVEHDDIDQPAPAPRFSRTPAEIQGPGAVARASTRKRCSPTTASRDDEVDALLGVGRGHPSRCSRS